MNSSSHGPQACAYCGLPLAETVRSAALIQPGQGGTPASPWFCCFGCRFAYQVASEGGAEGQARWTLTRLGLAIFLTMNVMMFTMALWTEDVYVSDAAALSTTAASSLHELLRYLCLLLAAPVLLLLGGPLLENAVQQVRAGILSTDLLIVLGVVASFAYSAVSVVRGTGHVYFEVGCVVLLAVTLGRWLEATAKTRATRALETLARLLPERVWRLDSRPGGASGDEPAYRQEEVALRDVRVGDQLRIRPGERIPVDGVVRHSRAAVDEQIVTGESHPVVKDHGDPVHSGALNLDGDLIVAVSAPPTAGTLQRLIESVRKAAEQRGRVQRLADRVAAWFIPGTALVALATFVGHGLAGSWETATLNALAVVLIACPCAIGIATPLALWAALGRASSAGVLFRSGDALTTLAQCRTIGFDKTGTLTRGALRVAEVLHTSTTTNDEVRERAAVASAATRHVVAEAIQQYTGALVVQPAGGGRTVPGRGVIAPFPAANTLLYLGSLAFLDASGLRLPGELVAVAQSAAQAGYPITALGWDGQIRALFQLEEVLRPDVAAVLQSLRSEGCDVVGLTGDPSGRIDRWQAELGIRFEAGLLPEEKRRAIQQLRRRGPVAMVGDGLNDAPALAEADVGIALGCGADVSREAAEICLLGDDLTRLPWARQLARRTSRTITQNLFWAFAYNVVGIGLAVMGLLHPALAAAAMVLSSLFVVSNSLRLSQFDSPQWPAGFHAAPQQNPPHHTPEASGAVSKPGDQASSNGARDQALARVEALSCEEATL